MLCLDYPLACREYLKVQSYRQASKLLDDRKYIYLKDSLP